MKIILGSSSPSRKKLLKNAGIKFTAKKPPLNETSEKRKFRGTKKALALYLAEKKALSVKTKPENIVIGADQVLIHSGKIYNKPRSINEAKKHLRQLSDRTHNLVSGLC